MAIIYLHHKLEQIPDLILQSCQNLFKSKDINNKVTFEDNFIQKLFLFLKLQATYRGKIKQIFALTKYLISPNLRDWSFYPLPKSLYFLYYIIRPFRLTSKLIFKT